MKTLVIDHTLQKKDYCSLLKKHLYSGLLFKRNPCTAAYFLFKSLYFGLLTGELQASSDDTDGDDETGRGYDGEQTDAHAQAACTAGTGLTPGRLHSALLPAVIQRVLTLPTHSKEL